MGLRWQKNTTDRFNERPRVQTPERRHMDSVQCQTIRTLKNLNLPTGGRWKGPFPMLSGGDLVTRHDAIAWQQIGHSSRVDITKPCERVWRWLYLLHGHRRYTAHWH